MKGIRRHVPVKTGMDADKSREAKRGLGTGGWGFETNFIRICLISMVRTELSGNIAIIDKIFVLG